MKITIRFPLALCVLLTLVFGAGCAGGSRTAPLRPAGSFDVSGEWEPASSGSGAATNRLSFAQFGTSILGTVDGVAIIKGRIAEGELSFERPEKFSDSTNTLMVPYLGRLKGDTLELTKKRVITLTKRLNLSPRNPRVSAADRVVELEIPQLSAGYEWAGSYRRIRP